MVVVELLGKQQPLVEQAEVQEDLVVLLRALRQLINQQVNLSQEQDLDFRGVILQFGVTLQDFLE